MRKLIALPLCVIVCSAVTTAQALDEKGLAALVSAVHNICVQPDQKGKYLKIEGDLSAGAILKIVGVSGAGKITKEDWEGISQRLDEYKTDPRACAESITPVLANAMGQTAPSLNQTTSGQDSPAIGNVGRDVNLNIGR